MFGKREKPQPLALDLGYDSVKLLQVQVAGGKLSAKAAFRAPLRNPGDAYLPAALELTRNLIRQHGLVGSPCVACLPRHIVQTKNLRLPLMPAAELAAAVQFEAVNLFPFDTELATVQYLAAGEVRHGADVRQEIIVFAAKNEEIDQFVDQLHRIGVVPVSLDVEPVALFRSVERFVRRREDEQEVSVLVDVGARRSQVVIGKGRELSFFKTIEIGGQRLNSAVSRKLGISVDEARSLRKRLYTENNYEADAAQDETSRRDAVRQAVLDATRSTIEELAREIALCLRYHSVTFRGHRPSRLRLLGGEAHDTQLLSILKGSLPVPVEAGRPLFSVDLSATKVVAKQNLNSEWATAFGLALRQTQGTFAPMDGAPRPPGTWQPAVKSNQAAEKNGASSSSITSAATPPASEIASPTAGRGGLIDLHQLIPPPGAGPIEPGMIEPGMIGTGTIELGGARHGSSSADETEAAHA